MRPAATFTRKFSLLVSRTCEKVSRKLVAKRVYKRPQDCWLGYMVFVGGDGEHATPQSFRCLGQILTLLSDRTCNALTAILSDLLALGRV
jgi:hypothetical protein